MSEFAFFFFANLMMPYIFQFSPSVMSDSLWPHGLQLSRLPCPSPTPRAWLNSCASSRRCHPNTSSCVIPVFSCSVFPSTRVFSSESVLCIRWPKYWNFSISISPSSECSGLISFRIDWFNFLAVPGTLKSLLQHHSSKASVQQCSAFFMVQLSHLCIHTWPQEKPLLWLDEPSSEKCLCSLIAI